PPDAVASDTGWPARDVVPAGDPSHMPASSRVAPTNTSRPNMRKTCRLLIAAFAAVSLAACQDAPVAPGSSAGPGLASASRSDVEYENFRTTRPGIFFLQLPCAAGEPGEFLRVSGEWETWGRRPVFESYSSSDVAVHINVHSKFEGTGIGQNAGRT